MSETSVYQKRCRSGWEIKNIKRALHFVRDDEIKARLAELWEILVEGRYQFDSRSQVLINTDSSARLFNPLLKKRNRGATDEKI